MQPKKRNDLEFYDRSADEWWDEAATIYALARLNPPRFAFFDRHLTDWQGISVLDVGCGGGYTCEFMAHRGAIVSGIDQSAKCIDAAQRHAAVSQLSIDYQQGVAEALPHRDNTFDAVICVDVLEHVADVTQVLSEIARVMKPGGYFFFDTINRTFKSRVIMIWLLENILGDIQPGVHDWRKFIKPEELVQLLQHHHFGTIDLQGFDMFGRPFTDYLRYKKTGEFQVQINRDTSVMYIGKAVKL